MAGGDLPSLPYPAASLPPSPPISMLATAGWDRKVVSCFIFFSRPRVPPQQASPNIEIGGRGPGRGHNTNKNSASSVFDVKSFLLYSSETWTAGRGRFPKHKRHDAARHDTVCVLVAFVFVPTGQSCFGSSPLPHSVHPQGRSPQARAGSWSGCAHGQGGAKCGA